MSDSRFVADKNFILATRDVGYRNTTTAVAELIDNALQAGATNVDLIVGDDHWDGKRSLSIAVLDNGAGMNRSILRNALKFGGSTRFNNRSSMGRFGMGLPNSALSQSKRLEVYSWQEHERPLFTHIDVDEILTGSLKEVPLPVRKPLPNWLRNQIEATGTLVIWRKCDRLTYKRSTTLVARLLTDTGRVYRHFLWAGVSVTVNGTRVTPRDPLFERNSNSVFSSAVFEKELEYEIKVPDTARETSIVRIRFTLLPIAAMAQLSRDAKQALGVVGGAGASIVRAGREIAHGWHFMGSKRRENYDDWWRCEVRFEPDLDEWFGVSHNKQGIRPNSALIGILSPAVESTARLLNARVRGEFVRIAREGLSPSKQQLKARAIESAGSAENRLLPLQVRCRRAIAGSTHVRDVCNLSYRIDFAPLRTPLFYRASLVKGTLVLMLNTNHPFFLRIYLPACESSDSERFRVECLLLAVARADLASTDSSVAHRTLDLHRESWSDALFAFLSGT